jgi:hypothetical protein
MMQRIQKVLEVVVAVILMVGISIPAAAQKPDIFDVSDVVVGAQRIETRYFYAVGKWSDAGEHIGPMSTQIQCYKSLGFCDVANAIESFGEANALLDSYDILRWDGNEIIAVDSSPICMVNTLRVDLTTKRVTLSSSDKGVTKDPFCKGSDKLSTAVLLGVKGIVEQNLKRTTPKK